MEKSINEKENKLTSLNTRKSNVEEQLKQKRKKCAEDESAVDALCRNKTIDEYLSDLNKQLVSEQVRLLFTWAFYYFFIGIIFFKCSIL